MLQYLLWKAELDASIKCESEELDYDHDDLSEHKHTDTKSTIKTQAYLGKALTHFESLKQLEISERDNVNVFTMLHYKVQHVLALTVRPAVSRTNLPSYFLAFTHSYCPTVFVHVYIIVIGINRQQG